MKHTQNNTPLISRRFRHIIGGQPQQWQDLPDLDDWDFITLFLHGYEGDADVSLSYDISIILNKEVKEKDLNWLYDAYPQLKGYNTSQIKMVLNEVDKKLFLRAKKQFLTAVRKKEIEIRRFMTYIANPRFEDDTRIWLWYSQDNPGQGIYVDQEKLYNIPSRTLDEDGEEVQVLYTDDNGKKRWMYVQNVDIE